MRHILWHSGGIKQSSGGACKWCSQKVSPAQVPQGPCQEASTSGGRGAGLPGEENQVSQPKENEPRGQENHWIMSPLTCLIAEEHLILLGSIFCCIGEDTAEADSNTWGDAPSFFPICLSHFPPPLPVFLLSFLYLPPSLPSFPPPSLPSLPPHLPPFPTLFSYNSSSFFISTFHIFSSSQSYHFRKPVQAKLVPDYYNVIKFPMDLQTMKDVRLRATCM